MSFDRFLAFKKAFDSRKWLVSLRSPSASCVINAIGWIFSVLFCVQLYRYSRITACNTCGYIFPKDMETRPNGILPSFFAENKTITREDFSEPIILSPFNQLFKDYFYDNKLHLTGTTSPRIPGLCSQLIVWVIQTIPIQVIVWVIIR